jgi:hypothetical protein
MAKYILLECNRLRGTNILNEVEDEYKNKWTNLVSSTGIIINKGDNLEIDQVIVNSRGATEDVMEFQGTKNEKGFLDNKARLEYSFYINHNGTQTARMPFINTRTFRGGVDIQGVDIHNNPPSAGGTPKSNNGVNPPFADLTRLLSCRSLGENLFFGAGSGGGMNIYDNTQTSICVNLYYCRNGMLFRAKTTQTGASGAGDVNGGYDAGVVYNTTLVNSPSGGTGSGLRVKIEQTTTSGNIYGIVQSWSIQEMGQGYLPNDVVELNLTGTPTPTTHRLTIMAFPDIETFTSSNNKSFDGSRYYFANVDYTGLANPVEATGSFPSNDTANLVPVLQKRKAYIDLEVDKGFLTPDNVGQILTDQLHKPNKISRDNNTAPFIDYDRIKYFVADPNGNISSDFGRPVLIDTPTFKQSIANFTGSGVKGNVVDDDGTLKDTLTNCRRQFYNSIAWKDANRYFALKNCFYNFSFTDTDMNPHTDIRTGNEGTEYTTTTIGDFANLSNVKNMGVRVCLLNNFTAPTGNPKFVKYKKRGVIVSNLKFTQTNVNRLAENFHNAEVFTGNLAEKIDTTSSYYHDRLAVNLDIGMYDDELSTQGNLTKNGGAVVNNQRSRYACFSENLTATNCIVSADVDGLSVNKGFQRDFNNLANDGQELSSIWVYSRWKEGFAYQNRGNYDDGVVVDADQNNFIIQNDGVDGFDTTFGGNLANIDKFFYGSYENPLDGNKIQTHLDFQQMARDADLAIIPVFPRNTGSNKFGDISTPDNTQPYIGFISRYEIGDEGLFDLINLDAPDNIWVIDLKNAPMGIQMGFDPTFTRNEAVCVINPQIGNTNPDLKENYMNMVNIGASDPTISFNPQLSRFEISGLNTPTTIGNGLQSSVPETIQANPNPDQQIINVNRKEQVMRRQDKVHLDPTIATAIGDDNVIDMFNLAIQEEGTILDSQSGIALESYSLFDDSGNITKITDKDNYRDSMFDKMGFELQQIIGDYGNENATFINQFTFQEIPQTYLTGNQFNIKPITTGSYVSSSEAQTLSINEQAMPMYDLGVDTGCRPVEPSVSAGAISAFKLPVKLSFPYLCIYSSIPSGGVDTIYIGGSDGESKISCMGFLTRENNEGDYFYQGGTSFNFTATKDFTLSEVETDIRLPDGGRPKLDPHSAVIYKITKPIQTESNVPPPPQKKSK